MRKHTQSGASFISVREHNSETEVGLIMQSTIARRTEMDATSAPYVGKSGHYVAEQRPSLEYHLCNHCGVYVHERGFSPDLRNKNKLSHICKSCRAEMARQARYNKKRDVIKDKLDKVERQN